jgi:hypothetical protein
MSDALPEVVLLERRIGAEELRRLVERYEDMVKYEDPERRASEGRARARRSTVLPPRLRLVPASAGAARYVDAAAA